MKSIVLTLTLFVAFSTYSQSPKIKVTNDGVTLNNTSQEDPDPTAVLDVSSLNKGVLFPRLTQPQIDQITAPAQGLLIFNINKRVYEFWNGDSWIEMGLSVPETPPTSPSDLIATAFFDDQVNLAWTDNSSNESSFEVWRSNTSGSGYQVIATLNENEISFTDSNLLANTDYFYLVKAVKGALSSNSNEVFVKTENPFITIWNTNNAGSANNKITLPLISSGTYNMSIDWGDGSIEQITSYNQTEVTHSYSSSGTYRLRIIGNFIGWAFSDSGDKLKLLEIQRWGVFAPKGASVFHGCSNLNVSAVDQIDLSHTTNLSSFFSGCSNLTFNSSIDNWDTSGISAMNSAFKSCSQFNQSIDSWNVSHVGNFRYMFDGASNFNQSLNSWDMTSANDMSNMFSGATSFNGNISSWNVQNVTNMTRLFSGCINFNQNISSWNPLMTTGMRQMFNGCSSFDQPIGNWNTSLVTNFSETFKGCTSFNQPLLWNTISTTTMQSMFNGCSSFDQDLSSWNVSNVTDMVRLFASCSSFDQDLSSWDISSVTSMRHFLFNASISTTNYDAMLISWASQAIQNNVEFSAGGSKYSLNSAAATARMNLSQNYFWTITDDGGI